jgi:NADH-quinone oxidoreductase E subunit
MEFTILLELGPILSRYTSIREDIIPILHEVQREIGYLSPEAIKQVAEYLNLSASTVYGVATFYSAFKFKPSGKHSIKVCRGTACHIKGTGQVLDEIEKRLGVKAGETTADGKYTLETEACFGSCALAPVVVLDGKAHGRVTPSTINSMLRGSP